MSDWADIFWIIRQTDETPSSICGTSLYELPNFQDISSLTPLVTSADLRVNGKELIFYPKNFPISKNLSFNLESNYEIQRYYLDRDRMDLYVLIDKSTRKCYAFMISDFNHATLFESYYRKITGKSIEIIRYQNNPSRPPEPIPAPITREKKEPAYYKFSSPVTSQPRPSLYDILDKPEEDNRVERNKNLLNSSFQPLIYDSLNSSCAYTPSKLNKSEITHNLSYTPASNISRYDSDARFPRQEVITPPQSIQKPDSELQIQSKTPIKLSNPPPSSQDIPTPSSVPEARFPRNECITPARPNLQFPDNLLTPSTSKPHQVVRFAEPVYITPPAARSSQADSFSSAEVLKLTPSRNMPGIEDSKYLESIKSSFSSSNQILFSSTCDLYEFLSDIDDKVPIYSDANIYLKKQREYVYMIEISRNTEILKRVELSGPLIDKMPYAINTQESKLMWIDPINLSGEIRCWVCVIHSRIEELQLQMSKITYEVNKKTCQIKEDTREWVQSVNAGDDEREDSYIEELESADWDEHYTSRVGVQGENKESRLSQCNPLTFVAQNDKIKVFDTNRMFTYRSQVDLQFEPKNILPIHQDTKMLVLDDKNPLVVHLLDISTSSIEATFTLSKPANNIYTSHKLSPQTTEQTFFSLNSKGLTRHDLRMGSEIKSREYKSDSFTSAAILRDGRYVLADESGKIRLYPDMECKNAMNIIPSLGDTIFYIDATIGGDWVLATTLRYLILIPTKSRHRSGYDCRLGRKRPPKKLTISPEDLARYNIREVRFTPAKFNVDALSTESSIVTSTGNFLVIWDFAKIKQGKLFEYKIKRMDELLIGGEFGYGRVTEIVATMPNKLTLQKRKI
jgi:hypothetical protein